MLTLRVFLDGDVNYRSFGGGRPARRSVRARLARTSPLFFIVPEPLPPYRSYYTAVSLVRHNESPLPLSPLPPLSSIDLGFSLSSPVIAFHVPSFCSRSIYRWERSRNRREDTISPLSALPRPPLQPTLPHSSSISFSPGIALSTRERNATRATLPSLFFHIPPSFPFFSPRDRIPNRNQSHYSNPIIPTFLDQEEQFSDRSARSDTEKD